MNFRNTLVDHATQYFMVGSDLFLENFFNCAVNHASKMERYRQWFRQAQQIAEIPFPRTFKKIIECGDRYVDRTIFICHQFCQFRNGNGLPDDGIRRDIRRDIIFKNEGFRISKSSFLELVLQQVRNNMRHLLLAARIAAACIGQRTILFCARHGDIQLTLQCLLIFFLDTLLDGFRKGECGMLAPAQVFLVDMRNPYVFKFEAFGCVERHDAHTLICAEYGKRDIRTVGAQPFDEIQKICELLVSRLRLLKPLTL